MIALVDYGVGNLVSVKKAIEWVGQECTITSDPGEVEKAAKVVLPGVGHFASTAMLRQSGLAGAMQHAIERKVPFLGICVGMQWMFGGSQESPGTPGSGLFRGECERFPQSVKSPHVGWNQLEIDTSSPIFREYGGRFSAAVERDHLFGVQFHPEKSGQIGLKLLSNFCTL